MKNRTSIRFIVTLLLVASMVMPMFAAGGGRDGRKHFNEGLKYEVTEEWDKASEEFALAVTEGPKNPEYRLHLARALFNASQMFMKRGTVAAKESDFAGAYVAFRRAYAFDPTNELAKSEMDRMIRLQKGVSDTASPDKKAASANNPNILPASYNGAAVPQVLPQRLEKLKELPFGAGVDLQFIIKELAKDLDLNVLFDSETFRTPGRKTYIELHNVTSARALDYIFLQEGLFFQKVGPHTILVANQAQRTKFQQLVLRTFYLANAAPKDVAKVVQTAIPAQPGRSQTIVLTDDATNSITIRDTEENIRLIGQLIGSLDKDRAEVVMDVAIYEVNKNDLLQFGNQLGTAGQNGTLLNIGGASLPTLQQGATAGGILGNLGFNPAGALGLAIGLPTSQIAALQNRSDTKLIASTQIHAFNNEDSSARIGQRVPVRSATFQTGNNGGVGNGVVSDVINYEQVGLTLKFKPLVFPNQDVQVAMNIESKDVAGASTLTPTFTERTITGTARIQNNKTLLLASVAQNTETKGRAGIPLLGMIPIIGRLFTAPTRDNRQVDIVIAVTPRVIRAPAILPEDEAERPTGSLAIPTNNSLEAMVIQDEADDRLAEARRIPNTSAVQLPDQPVDTPTYTKSNTVASNDPSAAASSNADTGAPALKPIDSSVKTLQLNQTADTSTATAQPDPQPADKTALGGVELSLGGLPEMQAGEKFVLPVMIDGAGKFHSAVMGLKYDATKIAVRSVSYGDAFGTMSKTAVTPFLNQNGKTYVSFTAKDGADPSGSGILAFIEIEALTAGKPDMAFDKDVLNFLTADGKNFNVRFKE